MRKQKDKIEKKKIVLNSIVLPEVNVKDMRSYVLRQTDDVGVEV